MGDEGVVVPTCPHCNNPVDHVDHYGIEHTVYDRGQYRPLHGGEGLASEVDLRCGHCATSLPQEARLFFYPRWVAVKEATAALRAQGHG